MLGQNGIYRRRASISAPQILSHSGDVHVRNALIVTANENYQ